MSVWRFASALAFLAWAGLVSAAQPLERPSSPSAPEKIVIISQSLVFKNQENTAFFEGKVVMTKADFVMHADHMVIYFAGNPSPSVQPATGKPNSPAKTNTPELPTFGNRAVSLIEATGNVIMEQKGKKSKSKKALYYQTEDKLILTGEPEVWEEAYRITGTKMTMFLKEDRSIVESSRVVINDTEPASR